MNLVRDIVIAGYAETPLVNRSGRSAYDLAGDVFSRLLESTGIEKSQVDGLSVNACVSEAPNPFFAIYMCELLALTTKWMNYSGLGGCSTLAAVARAASAIREGVCDAVVILGADAPSTAHRMQPGAYREEFQEPVGIQNALAAFGLLMSRYRHQFGLDPEALGKLAVTQRSHALLNGNACAALKRPLSLDDYLSSRMVADPLRILDCVMPCDGANALLVTYVENARRLGLKKMARPAAYAEITNHMGDQPCPDITETGFSVIGPAVLSRAGITPEQVRMVQPYDDFTIAVLLQLEAFEFCRRGEGCHYVNSTDLSFRGSLPLNTGGGQLSAGQPGLASGGLNLVEAVRQMFGEGGERQVAGPTNALVTGIGVIPYGRNWCMSAAMVLEAHA